MAFPADIAGLFAMLCSERECRELEQSELYCLQIRQVMHLTEYYFSSVFECSTFNGFLSYTQYNYQPQVQGYIFSSYSVHSPPIKHYS